MTTVKLELDLSGFVNVLNNVSAFFNRVLESFLDERMSELNAYVNEHGERIWATQGANIGADWQGNTLVDTGALRDSMSSVQLMRMGDTLVWASDLDYAEYVDERYEIYGVDEELKRRVIEEFATYVDDKLKELTR